MNLISPFGIKAFFGNPRSAAVIGNAPTVLRWNHGKEIDSHDLVIRFNCAQIDGFQNAVGCKTDILFVNISQPFDDLAAESLAKLNPKFVIALLTPKDKSKHFIAFRKWIGDYPVWLSFVPDLASVSVMKRGSWPTTGTGGLYLLLWLFDLESLFLTGFTFFQGSPGTARSYWEKNISEGPLFHDLEVERRLFGSLLRASGTRITITSELQEIIGRGKGTAANAGKNTFALSFSERGIFVRIMGRLAKMLLRSGMFCRRYAESW